MVLTENGIQNDLSLSKDKFKCDSDIKVVSCMSELSHLRTHWDRLILQSDAHVFQTFEWIQTWWKHFGGDHELHVVTIWQNKELIGIAPFFIEIEHIFGLKKYNTLRFLGDKLPFKNTDPTFLNYSPSDYLGVISHFYYEEEVAELLFNHLNKIKNHCDRFEFNELPENSFFVQKIYPHIKKYGWVHQKQKMDLCPVIELPATACEYMDSLTSKTRYNINYAKRAVTDKNLFDVKTISSLEEFEDSFALFIALHKKRWEEKGLPGIFTTGKFQNFLHEVLRIFFKKGYLNILKACSKDGDCFAIDLTFEFNHHTYGYQKGFDATSPYAKYSPGRALTYFILCNAIANNNTTYEMLRGAENYKMHWATTTRQNWCIICINRANTGPGWNRLYQISRTLRSLKERLRKEVLTITVSAKNNGVKVFFINYIPLVIERIKEKLPQHFLTLL